MPKFAYIEDYSFLVPLNPPWNANYKLALQEIERSTLIRFQRIAVGLKLGCCKYANAVLSSAELPV
jgi:hypothetical protein